MITALLGARLLADPGQPGHPGQQPVGELVDIGLTPAGTIACIEPAGTLAGTAGALECAGRYVTSGLWDEHVHLSQWAMQSARIDLGELWDLDAALARVAAAAATATAAASSGTAPLIAVRARGALWGDALTLARLDAVTGELPTVLIGVDLHSAWLNSAACAHFGVPLTETGRVVEDACFALVGALDRVTDTQLDAQVATVTAAAAARGVVGVVDFEMRWGIADWQRRVAAGHQNLRVDVSVYPQHLDRAAALGYSAGQSLDDSGLLTVGPLKIIADGSLGTTTALCCDPYPDGSHGLQLVAPDELLALLRRARDLGLQPAVHAIGDRANREALRAFAAAGVSGRIEHAQLLDAADVQAFAELGVTASVQPEHLLDDREAAATLWPGREARILPLASLLRAGVTLAFGSDAPVAPLDPWRGIAAAVSRCRAGDSPVAPQERLTPRDALAASMRGPLVPRVGDPADLVLLDADPLAISPEALALMPVSATLLNGRLTHLAPALASSVIASEATPR